MRKSWNFVIAFTLVQPGMASNATRTARKSPQHKEISMHNIFFLIACGLLVVDHRPALAGNIIVGVNTPGVQSMNDQQQDGLIEQLHKNGVTTVRVGIGGRFSRFTIEAHKYGIGAAVVVITSAENA